MNKDKKFRPMGQYITDYEGREYPKDRRYDDCYHQKPMTDEKIWVCVLCGSEISEVDKDVQ